MQEFDHTTYILYRYLKELSIRISYESIKQSLDTPMGSTLRGMSDTLDKFHIEHEVYQLPAEYLQKLEYPFIATIQNGHFCIVKNIKGKEVTLISDNKKESSVSLDFFLTIWTGIALTIRSSQKIQQEPYYRIKQIVSYLYKYRVGIILISLLCLLISPIHIKETFFNLTTWIGLIISISIIYKESYDKDFLQHFCKIGSIVDCNKILHSKAANIKGVASLGEMALIYFATLSLYAIIHESNYLAICSLTTIVALIFTLWSVIYQVAVKKRLCMLCTLLDIIIWIQAITLYSSYPTISFHLRAVSFVLLLLLAGICSLIWYSLKELIHITYQNKQLRFQKGIMLSYPNLLDILLPMEFEIPHAECTITLNNGKQEGKNIQIIINPHCKHCAREYKEWTQLNVPLHLLFSISNRNDQDKEVALAVISCYIKHGFQQAMQLLGEWFENQDNQLIAQYPLAPNAEQILEAQQVYCREIHLRHTPFITINERETPKIYTMEDLRYIL